MPESEFDLSLPVVAALAFTAIHLISSGGQTSVLEHVLYLTDASLRDAARAKSANNRP